MSKKLAITRGEKDLLRIIPFGETEKSIDLKFSLLNNKYNVEFSDIDKKEEIFFDDEVTYHSSRGNKSAKILIKNTDKKEHETKIENIKDLNLFTEFPIPVCKLQIGNNFRSKKYTSKESHSHLDLLKIDKKFPKKVNTVEIYVAPRDFDWDKFIHKWPTIDLLSILNSMDYLTEGFRVNEDIYNLIYNRKKEKLSFKKPIRVKNIQIRTKFYYNSNVKENTLIFYKNKNFIEYLANVLVSIKHPEGNTPSKPAFEWDLKRQKKNKLSTNKKRCDWKNHFNQFISKNNPKHPEGIIIPRL